MNITDRHNAAKKRINVGYSKCKHKHCVNKDKDTVVAPIIDIDWKKMQYFLQVQQVSHMIVIKPPN